MIGKPVITGFTIESDVEGQPPVELHPHNHPDGPRPMIVDRIKIVLERFGPARQWGAREVWAFGQVPEEVYRDVICWRQMSRLGWEPEPVPVEDSASLPEWIAAFVKERLQRTTQ